ncbi:hypothetical protein PVK06_001271 [Gossypium arboreum]|uniref:Uncharacterized protein n=1 Tax=Gossypium arboreum TaxID=29729 RepID=A0ABR0R1S9_GOSAR|nr:hypothetical protein PVK06_001271 [Gossypium arboreum]
MDKVINCLTDRKGEWKRQSSTNLPLSFKQSSMSPQAKMMSQFICTRIYSYLNSSNIDTFRAIIIFAMLQKEKICIEVVRWTKEVRQSYVNYAKRHNLQYHNFHSVRDNAILRMKKKILRRKIQIRKKIPKRIRIEELDPGF